MGLIRCGLRDEIPNLSLPSASALLPYLHLVNVVAAKDTCLQAYYDDSFQWICQAHAASLGSFSGDATQLMSSELLVYKLRLFLRSQLETVLVGRVVGPHLPFHASWLRNHMAQLQTRILQRAGPLQIHPIRGKATILSGNALEELWAPAL